MKALARVLLALCVAPLGATAWAQAKLDTPPPLPPETKASSPRPAPRIEAPDSDVEQPLPPAKVTSPETRIEQRRQGNRVVEIVVTPAGSTRSYVINNREGMRPLSPHELSAGLSTPKFLRFDF